MEGFPESHRITNLEYSKNLILEGKLKGYLAFDENEAIIGWCNSNGKENLPRLSGSLVEEKTKSVVCFLIDPDHRRLGIATALLERVIADAKEEGFRFVESYPKKRATSDSGNYHGPYPLYRKFGFMERKEDKHLVMFLEIKKRRPGHGNP